jgi:hypothetical protein
MPRCPNDPKMRGQLRQMSERVILASHFLPRKSLAVSTTRVRAWLWLRAAGAAALLCVPLAFAVIAATVVSVPPPPDVALGRLVRLTPRSQTGTSDTVFADNGSLAYYWPSGYRPFGLGASANGDQRIYVRSAPRYGLTTIPFQVVRGQWIRDIALSPNADALLLRTELANGSYTLISILLNGKTMAVHSGLRTFGHIAESSGGKSFAYVDYYGHGASAIDTIPVLVSGTTSSAVSLTPLKGVTSLAFDHSILVSTVGDKLFGTRIADHKTKVLSDTDLVKLDRRFFKALPQDAERLVPNAMRATVSTNPYYFVYEDHTVPIEHEAPRLAITPLLGRTPRLCAIGSVDRWKSIGGYYPQINYDASAIVFESDNDAGTRTTSGTIPSIVTTGTQNPRITWLFVPATA